MDPRRPVLPSQRLSPEEEYAYDGQHHEVMPSTRQPLGEATGNVQPHNLAALALCQQQNQLSVSPPVHSIPTPPIVPTQTLPSTYGTSFRSGRSLQRNVSLQDSPMGYPRGSKNPIYSYKHFADYRNKVTQKEIERENPTWPLWLEDAFLDALLLIPQMGRKKYSSKTILYGRNMLITEYLWIYHWLLHPPQNGERIPDRKQREKCEKGKPHPMFRGRKQVSSHIQVLKGFFNTLPTFHFFFPRQKDSKEDEKRLAKEDDDTESFKDNQVLAAIADGRLPPERPNYEYFARILGADNDVYLRPKQCWIFVSASNIALKEKHVAGEDGASRKQISGHTPDGQWLVEADYPHLRLNDDKEYKTLMRKGGRQSVLLHEYTRSMTQKESSSVKDVSKLWETRFPELREKLASALASDSNRASDERTSRCVVGPCDTFHFEVVLDLHANSKFPSGAELNGMVELAISRLDLHNHSWRSFTSVAKPADLFFDDEEELWEHSSPVEVAASHRVNCHKTPCDCAARGSRDTICVPFPAASWANTFIKLAPYVNAEREKKRRDRAAKDAGHAHKGGSSSSAGDDKRQQQQKGGSAMPSAKDLLSQVAMYQEIWSAPADRLRGDGDHKRSSGKWTRRAVLLWTFSPVREETDDKNKTHVVSAGANWRFLTKMDPASQYHQQQAYLPGPPNVSRDAVMSPNPPYAHHLNAAMHEHFSSSAAPSGAAAYDPGMTFPSQPHPLANGITMIDTYNTAPGGGGLATPPPTAGLQPSGFGFETSAVDSAAAGLHHQGHGGAHMGFMSDSAAGASFSAASEPQSSMAVTAAGPTDPFLAGLTSAAAAAHPVTTTAPGSYDDQDLQAWAGGHGLHGLDDPTASASVNWGASAGYLDGASGHAHQQAGAHHHHPHNAHQQHHIPGVSWADTAAAAALTATTSSELRDAQWAHAAHDATQQSQGWDDHRHLGAATGGGGAGQDWGAPSWSSGSGGWDHQQGGASAPGGAAADAYPLATADAYRGRKRGRTESLEDESLYPATAMRKLTHPHAHLPLPHQHHPHHPSGVPTAIMDEYAM